MVKKIVKKKVVIPSKSVEVEDAALPKKVIKKVIKKKKIDTSNIIEKIDDLPKPVIKKVKKKIIKKKVIKEEVIKEEVIEINNEEDNMNCDSDLDNMSSDEEDNTLKSSETDDGINRFEDIKGISKWVLEGLSYLNIQYPSAIQKQALPIVLKGENLVGLAKTGTGKTLCYALPMLESLSKDPFTVHSLVLAPVRELAYQIADQINVFGKPINVRTLVIVGGRCIDTQKTQLLEQRPHIVVATPGRLCDLLRHDKEACKIFNRIKVLVFDEADRILTKDFESELGIILLNLPKKEDRQTLFFSATITENLRLITENKNIKLIDAINKETIQLKEEYIFCPSHVKFTYLNHIISEQKDNIIIFCSTLESTQLISTFLEELNYTISTLHSLQSQRSRLIALARFRAQKSKILIATDVAARGLDIPAVKLVINFELPQEPEEYVHRTGRTARAGASGAALSFVCQISDAAKIQRIEKLTGRKLTDMALDEDVVLKKLNKTSKCLQKAQLLLEESGFSEKLAEHKEKKMQFKASQRDIKAQM